MAGYEMTGEELDDLVAEIGSDNAAMERVVRGYLRNAVYIFQQHYAGQIARELVKSDVETLIGMDDPYKLQGMLDLLLQVKDIEKESLKGFLALLRGAFADLSDVEPAN